MSKFAATPGRRCRRTRRRRRHQLRNREDTGLKRELDKKKKRRKPIKTKQNEMAMNWNGSGVDSTRDFPATYRNAETLLPTECVSV